LVLFPKDSVGVSTRSNWYISYGRNRSRRGAHSHRPLVAAVVPLVVVVVAVCSLQSVLVVCRISISTTKKKDVVNDFSIRSQARMLPEAFFGTQDVDPANGWHRWISHICGTLQQSF